MKKDMLDLVNALVDAGYTVELTSKHTKVRGGKRDGHHAESPQRSTSAPERALPASSQRVQVLLQRAGIQAVILLPGAPQRAPTR